MIEYVEGTKGLWTDDGAQDRGDRPFMVVRCIITGECGCRVYCGMLMHNHEQGVSWFPCDRHKLSEAENPQERFRRSLTENPQARPVEDVIAEILDTAQATA